MTRLLLALVVATSGACSVPGVPQSTSNPKVKVEALFDVDGHRVYRFEDSGHYVYFVLPARGERIASTAWTVEEDCGEDCSKSVPQQVVTQLEARR